jgi:hypothetical protein
MATNSGMNANVQTLRRQNQQHISKSRTENPSTLDAATRARPTGAHPARDLDGAVFHLSAWSRKETASPLAALRPNHVSSVSALWPDAVWSLS